MSESAEKALSALRTLLEKERESQLMGRVEAVAHFATEREIALRALIGHGADALPSLDDLMAEISRNQRLGEATIAGLKSAITKLQSIRSIDGYLESYDKFGQRQTHTAQMGSGFERRS